MNDNEIDFRAVVGVLRRQARLIGLTVFLVMGAALIFAISAKPLYRAEALILVDPTERNLLNPAPETSVSSSHLNARVESEVEILRSPTIALAVVEEAGLITDPEFGPSLSVLDQLLQAVGIDRSINANGDELLKQVVEGFLDARDVGRRGLTFIISVAVETEDPARSARLANTLAQTYIAKQVAAKVRNSLAARDILQGQIATAQQHLASSEGALDNFIFENLQRLETEAQSDALSALRARYFTAQDNRRADTQLSKLAEASLAGRDWSALSRQLQDEALAQLEQERATLQRRLGRVEQGTPLEIDLRAALEKVESNLGNQGNVRLAALRDRVSDLDDQITQTRDAIRTELLRSELSSTTLAEIFAIQQSAELSRRQVQTLLSRMSELEAQAAVQVADSRIVSEALPPRRPSFPNTPLILALALVAGVGAGTGLAFANEFYIGGVSSDTQLSNILGVPVGSILPIQRIEKSQLTLADGIVDKPMSGYAEAFRQLRATIDQRMAKESEIGKSPPEKKRGTIILVTSSVPLEGKSTSALSLARTYALSGDRTVLIDADLRNPSVARQLGAAPENGVSEFLSLNSKTRQDLSFIADDPKTELNVLLGGQPSEIATDQLLASDPFQTLLDQMSENADVVIVDSPPIVPVVDARYIVPKADVVLMIVRCNSTKQSDMRHSMEQIKTAARADTEIFSVLNYKDLAFDRHRYYDYYGQ
ncbi:MAG: Wzz/FepE/Etk N-terminal domain-containing protein [Pseudomonadota bacterium]